MSANKQEKKQTNKGVTKKTGEEKKTNKEVQTNKNQTSRSEKTCKNKSFFHSVVYYPILFK